MLPVKKRVNLVCTQRVEARLAQCVSKQHKLHATHAHAGCQPQHRARSNPTAEAPCAILKTWTTDSELGLKHY
jgi:hypothetical protein